MIKRIIFLSLAILAGCGNPAPPPETSVKAEPVKPKPAVARPAANPWAVNSYAPKEGETEGRKFVRFGTDGEFSDATGNASYLYAEVIVNKSNAGIFLRELKKSNPPQLFSDPVNIKMVNNAGEELLMTSTRRWNSSGGILIERNNNDYSRFRIFMLQSKGLIKVEVKDSGNKTYKFTVNADGFSDSFNKI
jgi:hypothetical protein